MLLVGLGFWSSVFGTPTVRDQGPIGAGKSTIDRVVGQVNAHVPAGWLVDDAGYLENACQVTPWRDGVTASRTLTLSGPAGGEDQTLAQVASTLDGAKLSDHQSFFYDAGDFVSVRGRVSGAGTVGILLSTGCRPR